MDSTQAADRRNPERAAIRTLSASGNLPVFGSQGGDLPDSVVSGGFDRFFVMPSEHDLQLFGNALARGGNQSTTPDPVPLVATPLRISDLERLLTNGEPAELVDYVAKPTTGQPFFLGSTVPMLLPAYRARHSGILIPQATDPIGPFDLMATYITAREYIPSDQLPDEGDMSELVEQLSSVGSPTKGIINLILLNRVLTSPKETQGLTTGYLAALRPDLAERLQNRLVADDGVNRVLLSPQGILAALRICLTKYESSTKTDGPTIPESVLFVHMVSNLLYDSTLDGETATSHIGLSDAVIMEIVRSTIFYTWFEVLSDLSRHYLMWTRYGDQIVTHPARAGPAKLALDATGLKVEDWIAFGLTMMVVSGYNDGSLTVDDSFLQCGDPNLRDRFLTHVVCDVSSFADTLVESLDRPWDFLAFQQYPVLQINGALFVIDHQLLIERVTEGVYWNVLDHERSLSDEHRRRWTQSYGEALELYVLALLRRLAPPLLGDKKVAYSESDLRRVYTGKICDWVIDYGRDLCVFEIVSGKVTVGTRVHGEIPKFNSDTEKIILKKARQLDGTIGSLLEDESALTGVEPVEGRRIIPVVINPGTYPINPVTVDRIDWQLKEHRLLQDPRIESLCIIDVSEVELIEALLYVGGQTANDILRSWKQSSLAGLCLAAFLSHDAAYPDVEVGSLYPVREVDVSEMAIDRLMIDN